MGIRVVGGMQCSPEKNITFCIADPMAILRSTFRKEVQVAGLGIISRHQKTAGECTDSERGYPFTHLLLQTTRTGGYNPRPLSSHLGCLECCDLGLNPPCCLHSPEGALTMIRPRSPYHVRWCCQKPQWNESSHLKVQS